MALEGALLGEHCKGPAGLCDAVNENCFLCLSVHKDAAMEVIKKS